ncbi:MAG TPA: CHAD domain-containing protein [Micromonosporaceae bacterium]|jgi:CHAD domain-containing protein
MKPAGRTSPSDLVRIPSARRSADDTALRPSAASPSAASASDPLPSDPLPNDPLPNDAIVAYLRRHRDAIAANVPAVRAKDVDAVHDMRVSVRRIRSSLRTFRPTLDRGRSEWLRGELHWLADTLGAVRDTDVMFARLDDAIADEPPETMVGPVAKRIRRLLLDAGRTAHRDLAVALKSQRYRQLTAALAAFTSSRPRRVSTTELHRMAAKPLRAADVLLVAARSAHDPEDRDVTLHRARREFKRARYAIEVLVPIDGEPARTFAARISELQEVLGDHQDAIVTSELLRDYGMRAHAAGENAFSYGLLYRRQRDAGERALEGLDRAVRRLKAATYL